MFVTTIFHVASVPLVNFSATNMFFSFMPWMKTSLQRYFDLDIFRLIDLRLVPISHLSPVSLYIAVCSSPRSVKIASTCSPDALVGCLMSPRISMRFSVQDVSYAKNHEENETEKVGEVNILKLEIDALLIIYKLTSLVVFCLARKFAQTIVFSFSLDLSL